jgi:uncharacterized protein (DUF1697 family)
MSKLCAACEAAGFGEVRTVLSTGNLIFASAADEVRIREALSATIRSFGLANDVFLRRPDDFDRIVAANPFGDATVERPGKVLVLFFSKSLEADVALRLRKHRGPELIELAGREMFIDYISGIAGSRLAPAFVERLTGMPATARNWNTVLRLKGLPR